MFRRLPIKAWIGIGVGAVAVVAAVIVAIVMSGDEEAYRTIKVYELVGQAEVVRGSGKSINAYTDMRLESEDVVKTSDESYLQLKLDEDKYVLLEPNTEIAIEAVGTQKDSKTKITLRKGAVVNCIENKLSDESEYKIETPNSTMAVRGTTFRVEIKIDNNGESYAVVSVYEGTVVSNLIFPDGSVDSKDVEILKGKGVQILGTSETSMYITIDDKAKYEELDKEVLEFLKFVIEDVGKDLSITKEELYEFIEILGGTTQKPIETTSKGDIEETTKDSSQEETTTTEPEEETTTTKSESETTTTKSEDETTTTKPEGETTTAKLETETTTAEDDAVYYTVTFYYGSEVFSTQRVQENNIAYSPSIKPEPKGYWEWNFMDFITEDTAIYWYHID